MFKPASKKRHHSIITWKSTEKPRIEWRHAYGKTLGNVRSFIGNPGVTRKPINFKAKLPTAEILRRFFGLDQGGEEWKTWRQKAETVGASTDCSLTPGCSKHDSADDVMYYLSGKIDTSPKYKRGYTLPTALGHLFEDLVVLCFVFLVEMYGDEGVNPKFHSCGVLYDHSLGMAWSTASLDINATGKKCSWLAWLLGLAKGIRYPWDKVTIECKAPTNKKYSSTDADNPEEDEKLARDTHDPSLDFTAPLTYNLNGHPKDYMCQEQRQLSVSRSQLPTPEQIASGDHFSTLPGKEYSLLLCLEVPYKKDLITIAMQPPACRGKFPVKYYASRMIDKEGEEQATIEANKPFILKVWSTKYNKKFDDLTKKYYTDFISNYERANHKGREPFVYTHSREQVKEIKDNMPPALFKGAYEIGVIEEDLILDMYKKPTATFEITDKLSTNGLPVIKINVVYPEIDVK